MGAWLAIIHLEETLGSTLEYRPRLCVLWTKNNILILIVQGETDHPCARYGDRTECDRHPDSSAGPVYRLQRSQECFSHAVKRPVRRP